MNPTLSFVRTVSGRAAWVMLAGVFALSVLLSPLVLSGKVLAAACNPGTDRGQVSANVTIPAAKTYRVWSRMKVPDSSHDTYFLEIDGNQCIRVGGPQAANQWNWVDFKDRNTGSKINVSLSKGQHSLKFFGNEQGVKLDRVIFVSDHNCKPTSKTGEECDIPDDKTAPSVQLTAPAPNSKVSGRQKVAAKASDNAGVTKVEFFVNSVRHNIDPNAPYEFTLNTTDLQDGQHLLIAKAFDAAGNVSSDSYKITIDNSGIPTPEPPKNVKIESPSHDKATVTWEKTPGASGYQIFRNGVPIARVGPDATSYTDTDVLPNTDYDYQVSALNEFGMESVPSGKTQTKTQAVDDNEAPSRVSGLTLEPISSGQINLQWEAATDNIAVKFYDIYRSVNGGEMQRIALVASTSFGDVGLEASTEYSYLVRARDTNNNTGDPSDTVSASTNAIERRGVIYGTVRDEATARALQGATVVVTARDGKKYIYTTNSRGGYTIRGLEPGNYNASFRTDGYKSITRSFNSSNDVKRQNANLEKR